MTSLPNPILEALPNERAGLGLFRVTQDKRPLKAFSYLLKAYGSGAIRHALMVTFVAPFTFLEWMGWEQKG